MHGTVLGIDVGSTTAKAVVVARGRLLFERCERHRGRPHELTRRIVADARKRFGDMPTGVTGSLGVHLADELSGTPIHETHAVARAVRSRYPTTRTVIELGGQDAKILRLEEGYTDAEMNDRCAAGTGATIDRIASRLSISETELRTARLQGDLSVAAKCGVFAETDIVNLMKRGACRPDAIAALARAIVVQTLAVLARGRTLRAPVLLLGGPHAHLPILADAWREALETLWSDRGISDASVTVPEHPVLFGAIGAAEHVADEGRPLRLVSGVLRCERADGPLATDADAPRIAALACSEPVTLSVAEALRVHIGIDAGSTSSKVAVLDEDGALVASAYGPSHGNPVDDARARLVEIRDAVRVSESTFEVLSVAATGYGAPLLEAAFGTDLSVVETVAHTIAAREAMPGVDVVVDVGGTDVKIMSLAGEQVQDFFLSNQCSAGHGSFLATAAMDLGVPLDEYATRALSVGRMPRFTVGCGVFMDTDRVSFQRDGFDADELLAGLASALPRNIWEYVVGENPRSLGRRFLLTGGTQRNLAAAWAQAKYLADHVPGAEVAVHPHPALCGAIGAALTGMRQLRQTSSFVGLDALDSIQVSVQTSDATRCTRCDVGCKRSVVEAGQRRLIVGNACARGADLESTAPRSGHAADALAYEASRLFRKPRTRSGQRVGIRIGIPRVMGMYRSAPLLTGYLCGAGVAPSEIVWSPPTSADLFQRGARWGVTDPCFPSKLVLSHVDWLLHQEIDVLFMPALTHAAIAVGGTHDSASCPIVTACGHTSLAALRSDGDELSRRGIAPLTPTLTVIDQALLERQLHDAFGPLLGISADESRHALERGLEAQRAFHADCRRFGERVLRRARRDSRAVAVILARPYHADPGVQHGISTELAARGLPVLGISSLPLNLERTDVSDLVPLATNSGCAEKAWAARVIANVPELVGVDLSSFRCGQDASLHGTLADILAPSASSLLDKPSRKHSAMLKPTLRLHDLDEDRPTASLRIRIETFIHAVRRYEREFVCEVAAE